jgi:hypothetical protein
MSDDEPRLTPEQGIVAQGFAMGAEVAVQVPDRALAQRTVAKVAAAFVEGMRKGEAARAAMADEPEELGTIVGAVHTIAPDEIRERRWAD